MGYFFGRKSVKGVYGMKKGKFLFPAMLAVMLAFGFFLVSCGDDGSSAGGVADSSGAIKIVNDHDYATITWVEIIDAMTNSYVIDEGTRIASGSSRTYSNIHPDKYIVCVFDDDYGYVQSNQVTVGAGRTVTLTYNGDRLR